MASCRLYLISPPRIDAATFPAQLEKAFAGGDIGAFQLRLKDASDSDIRNAAKALQPVCYEHHCAFILNDRPDMVAGLNADGVHLGQEDLAHWPVEKTRRALGEEKIIGVSAHASKHAAMEAGEQGADYVAFGAFYPTKTKPPEKLAKYGTPTPETVQWWSAHTVLPCVAIGGMTPANCAPLVKAGADFIAAITSVWEHPRGPGAAVSEFNVAMRNV